MANIFLSYARADRQRAEKIARALEQAGHSVWWDLEVHAGSRFSVEIQRALNSADFVIVLWSESSVGSAWVQDEAAAGRDSGRLVPVLIDKIEPPLGFRQYQGIDYSGWSTRGKPRDFKMVLKAVDSKIPVTITKQEHPNAAPRRGHWLPAAAAIAGVGAAAAGIFLLRTNATQSSPTLVIAPAQSGDVRSSRDFAHQVALDFSRFQPAYLASVTVTEDGRSADYRAELDLERDGTKSNATIGLRIARHPGLLWANTIEGPSDRTVDLRQQAAALLSAVLRCAIEADASPAKLKNDDLRLYLDGCTVVSTDFWQANAATLIPTFKKVTQSNPNFAPGQALLALAYLNAFPGTRPSGWKPLANELRATLARAKSLDPNSDAVIAVDAMTHPNDPQQWDHAFPILDHGLALHPDSPVLLGLRSQWLMKLGRLNEAAVTARQALQQDPLSPQMRVNLIDALAYSGRLDAARQELAKAAAVWPNSTSLEDARYRLDLRYGDPQNALKILSTRNSGDLGDVSLERRWQDFLKARIDPSPASVETALNSFRDRYRRNPGDIPGYLQALGTFGRVDEAFHVMKNPVTLDGMEASTETLFRPHMRKILADPRFIEMANRLGLLGYWRKTDTWPDFCDDPALPYDCHMEATKYR